ncbi:hypothetical protein GCM10017562_67100 [Streptomyces roseofulvus]
MTVTVPPDHLDQRHRGTPPAHEQALTDIDTWWHSSFAVIWPRFYAYANAHVEQHGSEHLSNVNKTPTAFRWDQAATVGRARQVGVSCQALR